MTIFTQILNKFRKEALSERDKGDRFERLMQAYLKTTALYANLFEEVWLWMEFPYHNQLGGNDTGIDLWRVPSTANIGQFSVNTMRRMQLSQSPR